jgi:hypothetical protein
VQQTSDEGYIVSGIASSFFDVAGDIYLIKLNNVGDTIWTRTYGGLGYEAGAFVEQTSDGGFIVAGQTPAFGAGGFDAYLLKLTASGAISWTKTFGGIGLETASAVQQTSDGGYILAGQIETEGAGGGDFYLVKTDEFGGGSMDKNPMVVQEQKERFPFNKPPMEVILLGELLKMNSDHLAQIYVW